MGSITPSVVSHECDVPCQGCGGLSPSLHSLLKPQIKFCRIDLTLLALIPPSNRALHQI
ncbi:hypothetical protein Hanom_Chr04g00334331 [Helianthus anomalus]